ncbi:uncharacterized protein LOC121867826 [Homarus americanus]|nr:uncharacterized protein LOC121867826 [Homarus americanus]
MWTTGGATSSLDFCRSNLTNSYPSQATASQDQPMFPWPSDACHSAVGEQMASLTGRKVKVYEWPPQSDPELEKKRKRAIKAFKNRMKDSQQEEEQYMKLDTLTQEVSHLQREKNAREQTVAAMQAYINHLAASSAPQYNCDPW